MHENYKKYIICNLFLLVFFLYFPLTGIFSLFLNKFFTMYIVYTFRSFSDLNDLIERQLIVTFCGIKSLRCSFFVDFVSTCDPSINIQNNKYIPVMRSHFLLQSKWKHKSTSPRTFKRTIFVTVAHKFYQFLNNIVYNTNLRKPFNRICLSLLSWY